ncbi:hypothetical protein ACFL4D_02300 [Candidatus Margulisiibacteriota bacterium]
MITNLFIVYLLAVIPGLGHIALQKRAKGYSFLSVFFLLLGLVYLSNVLFQDGAALVRLAVAVAGLGLPLYLLTLTDLAAEMNSFKKNDKYS